MTALRESHFGWIDTRPRVEQYYGCNPDLCSHPSTMILHNPLIREWVGGCQTDSLQTEIMLSTAEEACEAESRGSQQM